MTAEVLIALIDRLRAMPTETTWVEFKCNHCPPEELGEYISALANSACLAHQPQGYLLFGIDDSSHEVVGTTFDPQNSKAKGNQDLLPWLLAGMHPNPGVEPHIVLHPGGRVVLLEIGPASGEPIRFYGKAYIRIGTSKTLLSNHPAKERAIWVIRNDWSAEVCEAASILDLDPDAIIAAREQFAIKHPGQTKELMTWDDRTFLQKAHLLIQGGVTNTALLLLGRAESTVLLSPAVARISWILKDSENRELDYEHIGPPFLLAGDRLLKRIRNLIVRTLPSGTLFPQEVSQYDPWVIRESLHNAIAHQDYGLRGRIVVVEFPEYLIISNVGDFIPGDVETVIQQDAPQAFYRNSFLADAMVEMNLIDTQGGGIKRMYETQRRRSFPLPDYDLNTPEQVRVTLSGRILDERYTRILMERSDLDLGLVMLLDHVQKGQRISRDDHRLLKRSGLVEGRYPSLMVSGTIARVVGETGRHIRERGLDKRYYLNVILELLREHGPATRRDVDEALISKLPDRLSAAQKKNKVHNLLQELAHGGLIMNTGSKQASRWELIASPPNPASEPQKIKEL